MLIRSIPAVNDGVTAFTGIQAGGFTATPEVSFGQRAGIAVVLIRVVVAVEVAITAFLLRDAQPIPALPLMPLQTIEIVVDFHDRVVAATADDVIVVAVGIRIDHDVVVAADVAAAVAIGRE